MVAHGVYQPLERWQGGDDLCPVRRLERGERLGEQAEALVAPVGELVDGSRGEVKAHAASVGVVATAFEEARVVEVAGQGAHRVRGEVQVPGRFPGPHAGVAAHQVEQLQMRARQSGHTDRAGKDPAANDPERPKQALCLVGQRGSVATDAVFRQPLGRLARGPLTHGESGVG